MWGPKLWCFLYQIPFAFAAQKIFHTQKTFHSKLKQTIFSCDCNHFHCSFSCEALVSGLVTLVKYFHFCTTFIWLGRNPTSLQQPTKCCKDKNFHVKFHIQIRRLLGIFGLNEFRRSKRAGCSAGCTCIMMRDISNLYFYISNQKCCKTCLIIFLTCPASRSATNEIDNFRFQMCLLKCFFKMVSGTKDWRKWWLGFYIY